MFCLESKIASMSSKIGDCVILPKPMANVTCHNEEIWEVKMAQITLEDVIKSSVLFLMSLATIIVNLIFLVILRSTKYHRRVQVQVSNSK